jgi:hypothetical protein
VENQLKAEIRLFYQNELEAQVIKNAISPDNMEVPSGLYIQTMRNGIEVRTMIDCQTRLQTLIATIDDLLACVSIAEKTFKVVSTS